jgi:hypothetical protein
MAYMLALAFCTIIAVPHLPRLHHPTIYSDDVARIADLQAYPLHLLWFRPFNEHMAPFFQTVSWVAWQAAGEDLPRAPLALTLASYLPFLLCLVLLPVWIRRETGSRTAALATVAVFSLSPLYAEAVLWYSASSFTWALLWTMIVLFCAGAAGGPSGWVASSGMLLGAVLAPACSTIGLLAGPLGTFRLMAGAGARDQPRIRKWSTLCLPVAGTMLYLVISSAFRYDRVIRADLDRESRIGQGIVLALQAPMARLVPGTFGLQDADRWLPPALTLALTALGTVAVIAWAARSPHRELATVALGLILGGYLLTYPVRNRHSAHWLFHNERFHLFPQLGLALLLALGTRRWAGWLDTRRLPRLAATTGLALVFLGIQHPQFTRLVSIYDYPEQRQTLAALQHLGLLCRAGHVSQPQCIAAVPPVWARWFQPEYNGLWMIPAPRVVSGAARSDAQVQRMLLGALSASERQALWGGMDVSSYAQRAEDIAGANPASVAVGQLVETDHTRSVRLPLGMGMRRYTMTGWPASLDFELVPTESSTDREPGVPRFLCLPCGPSAEPLEIWWARAGGDWSPLRCVRFRPDPEKPPREWALPLAQIPHWDPAAASRIRIRFAAAPVAIGTPRLLR